MTNFFLGDPKTESTRPPIKPPVASIRPTSKSSSRRSSSSSLSDPSDSRSRSPIRALGASSPSIPRNRVSKSPAESSPKSPDKKPHRPSIKLELKPSPVFPEETIPKNSSSPPSPMSSPTKPAPPTAGASEGSHAFSKGGGLPMPGLSGTANGPVGNLLKGPVDANGKLKDAALMVGIKLDLEAEVHLTARVRGDILVGLY